MKSDLIKTEEEIQLMRKAGKILGTILKELEQMVVPGIDAWKLEEKFIDLCKKNNVVPSCKNYDAGKGVPFPTGLCISTNDESVHCYPQKGQYLEEGDHVLIDTVVSYKGYHADSAITVPVGIISDDKARFLSTVKFAMDTAINVVKAGAKVGDISYAIQTIVETAGYNVLREYTGHGIGKSMHEEPSIPCFGKKGTGEELRSGMTITVEPLVCNGKPVVEHLNDDAWATRMKDGGNFAQYEHTVLVTDKGYEILTRV